MLELYGTQFTSRMLLGTAGYASPEALRQAVEACSAEIVTVSLRRESGLTLNSEPAFTKG